MMGMLLTAFLQIQQQFWVSNIIKNKRLSLSESFDRQHDYRLISILAPFPIHDSIQTGHCCFDDLATLSLSIF